MTTPASPEEFLREFAKEAIKHTFVKVDPDAFEQIIKGWAKLLELREQEARVNELNRVDGALSSLHQQTTGAGFVHYGEIAEWVEDRIAQLTTPNNTTNSLEDEEG